MTENCRKGFAGKGKPSGKFDDRGGRFDEEQPKKRAPMGTSRTANVWMAPGARPTRDGGGKTSHGRKPSVCSTSLQRHRAVRNVNRVAGDSDWIRAEEAPATTRFSR